MVLDKDIQDAIDILTRKPEPQPEEPKPEKDGFWKRLFAGLAKTRNNIIDGLDALFMGGDIDDDFYEELEEILIMADIGVATTEKIIDDLKDRVFHQHVHERAACKKLLMDTMKDTMRIGENAYRFEEEKAVVLFVGVNGVGKTTTVGKLGAKLKANGKKVIFAAADTFRAAAAEQLSEWAGRAGADIVKGAEGSDPGAVVFDAAQAAKARGIDVLLCDTAGRLHNKKNLMEELRKIGKILDKEFAGVYRETLLVVDGTTGQNALSQAKEFSEVTELSGIVITKLDGSAKGGIAVAIQSELGIPVKYIGVGEGVEDLDKFDADAFVDALFGEENSNE